MDLYFLRHCETDWNVEGRMQGHIDVPINENGYHQAVRIGKALNGKGIECIITSDLSRARNTASIISSYTGNIPVVFEKRLREACLGSLEGMTWNEIEEYTGLQESVLYSGRGAPFDFRLYGGESIEEVVARHQEFFLELLDGVVVNRMHMAKQVFTSFLIVGHGTSLGSILPLFGSAPDLRREEVRHISVESFDFLS